jgi:NitT/TauT family transport system ATP-binding protein
MKHIITENLSVVYRKPQDDSRFVALQNINLAIDKGSFVTIVGPSGCGKSSLLLATDGLIFPSEGHILVNGRPVQGPGPDRAMVFQEFALLPWRTVLGNAGKRVT